MGPTMDLATWLAFLAASTALLAIPGPTILLVMSYAISQGRSVAPSPSPPSPALAWAISSR